VLGVRLLDKVKAGASLADAAAADGLKAETKTGIKRGGASSPLSPLAVDIVFRTPKDGLATAEAELPAEQVVWRVTDIVVPSVDLAADETKRLRESLNTAMSEAIYAEYIGQIESEIGVTINPAGLRQVVTGQTTPDDN
jgi:peptidyl-prolyl cis-trans isomerase D